MTALKVLVEGVPLPDDEARALWRRFSSWMDAHVGDLAGFARTEGFTSLHPEMHGGCPVLVASRMTAQRPYATAPKKPATGGAAKARGRKRGPR